MVGWTTAIRDQDNYGPYGLKGPFGVKGPPAPWQVQAEEVKCAWLRAPTIYGAPRMARVG